MAANQFAKNMRTQAQEKLAKGIWNLTALLRNYKGKQLNPPIWIIKRKLDLAKGVKDTFNKLRLWPGEERVVELAI